MYARLLCVQVKYTTVEIYDATLRPFREDLLAVVKASTLPVLHLYMDVWKSKVSGESFIGTFGSKYMCCFR